MAHYEALTLSTAFLTQSPAFLQTKAWPVFHSNTLVPRANSLFLVLCKEQFSGLLLITYIYSFYLMHMSVLLTYMYMYHMHAVLLKVSMGHWILCSWGYGWLWTTNHPCGCCNQASTLNPWAISQAPELILSWCWHLKEADHVNSKLSLLKDII